MAKILYAGHTIPVPDGMKIDELAQAIQNAANTGTHTWLTVDYPGDEQQRVRLLFGPGIPAGILGDQMDGHEVDLSDENLTAFVEQANTQDN